MSIEINLQVMDKDDFIVPSTKIFKLETERLFKTFHSICTLCNLCSFVVNNLIR
jgi:hypothetical protein